MKQFLEIFKRVDGKGVLRQYTRANVLLFALVETLLLGFSKKSLEIVRLAVKNRILSKLRKKYRKHINTFKTEYVEGPKKHSKKVWICWLQGMEAAPEIVKMCYQSMQQYLPDREIVLITEKNYREYVSFPEFIQEKIDQGIITGAHMSDLLRLELLIKYGGTWIDSTVYCSSGKIPEYMFESDLFVFQNLKPGLNGDSTSISNWFITSCVNNPILVLTQKLLYEYWHKNNKLIDYFIFHDFFQIAIECYPEEWKKVVPFSNSVPHILLLRLFEEYDENIWRGVKEMTPFHKLTYKYTSEQAAKKNTYYKHIIGPAIKRC